MQVSLPGRRRIVAEHEILTVRNDETYTRKMGSSQTSLVAKCPSCNVEMRDMGDVPFRTGGTSGAAHLLFGNWAELGEGLLHLDAFVCHSCGRVEFFADSQTRDSLG
ncbi:MAG TPA: hypothetical protein VFV92_05215 [Candidatus Bathyarchaeia archaeon]|nr:hypothetical protein [Candidatus Bathyarchaeia archaeon]